MKHKIITEYINQVIEDIPGTCIHKKGPEIIRGYNCKYLVIPKSEYEDMRCEKLFCNVQPNCYCCWAEHIPVIKKERYNAC